MSAGEVKRVPRLATRAVFYSRVGRAAAISLSVVAAALFAGTLGYHFIANLSWLYSFHQASLLLSGMGPVETNLPDAGRIFESIYSLFCGVILLAATGILFAPIIHRVLHRFHVEDTDGER
ncbi:MAG TPA: hypothetical protein VGL25_00945 [Casimicrobiaceae bacterium]